MNSLLNGNTQDGPNSDRENPGWGSIGLHSAGRSDDALAVLKANLERHPNDRDTLWAALALSRERNDLISALAYAERLSRLSVPDGNISKLIDELRRSQPGQAR